MEGGGVACIANTIFCFFFDHSSAAWLEAPEGSVASSVSYATVKFGLEERLSGSGKAEEIAVCA